MGTQIPAFPFICFIQYKTVQPATMGQQMVKTFIISRLQKAEKYLLIQKQICTNQKLSDDCYIPLCRNISIILQAKHTEKRREH